MVTVAISGFHGAGKTTVSERLSEELGLRHVSAGKVFREMAEEKDMDLAEFSEYVENNPEIDKEIDQRTIDEAKKDNVLLDARLAGWMAEEADLRILLDAPLKRRVKRIAKREDRPIDEVKEETIVRGESEKKRFKEFYNIDVEDRSEFDIVLNTAKFTEEETVQILKSAISYVSD